MSLIGVQLGAGITVGSGIGIGATAPTFTLYPADISYNRLYYGGYTNETSNGFTCTGTSDTYNGVVYNLAGSLPTDIANIWTNAGLSTNLAYVWRISFATGGSVVSRTALNPNNLSNTIAICPIDQSNTGWQSGYIGGPTQAGTFTFPAVFTLYTPITQISNHNDWC